MCYPYPLTVDHRGVGPKFLVSTTMTETGNGVFSDSLLLRVRGVWIYRFQEGRVEADLDGSGGMRSDHVVIIVKRSS